MILILSLTSPKIETCLLAMLVRLHLADQRQAADLLAFPLWEYRKRGIGISA